MTKELIRAACGVIYEDGNILFGNIAHLNAYAQSVNTDGPMMQRGTTGDGVPFMGTMRQVLEDYQAAADAEAREVDRLNGTIADRAQK